MAGADQKASKDRKPGKARRILGSVLIAALALFTVYLCVVMQHRISTVVLKDTYRKIFHNELLLCGILLVFALDLRFGFLTKPRPLLLKIPGWLLRIGVTAFSLLILFFCGKVAAGSLINTAAEAENAIVLGMALEDGVPQKDLLMRLDTARDYLDAHPQATLILTGGNPDESGLTEAGVMRELLRERGVPEDRMVLEDKASSTEENFGNAARITDPAGPVVIISTDYHMNRAVRTARSAGFQNVMRLPAPSDPIRYGANLMWEVILDCNDLFSRL